MAKGDRQACGACGKLVLIKLDGTPRKHSCTVAPETGPGSTPAPEPKKTVSELTSEVIEALGRRSPEEKARTADRMDRVTSEALGLPREVPRAFEATYAGTCATCGEEFEEGEEIRADGSGGWECALHAEEDPEPRPASVPKVPAQRTAAEVSEAEAFLGVSVPRQRGSDGGAFVPSAEEFLMGDDPEPEPEVNVSGQPKARYEWRGRTNMGYLVTDPDTGDFQRYKNGKPKGFTRVTTFVEEASDSIAITAWNKRNVVIGASRRPDILARAHGLTHEDDRDRLDSLVAELEDAAGANVSSNEGTYLHEFTEHMDAGLKTPEDAPERYRAQLALYQEKLDEAGFEPVPGLIERTTMVSEFGGIVGTFDRILFHQPSGRYIVGDLKTGKSLEYSLEKYQAQEWLYARGVNTSGIYDWNRDVWEPATEDFLEKDPEEIRPIRVSESVGLIIHMPVQGPQAGEVNLVLADLKAGRRYAELCGLVRAHKKSKVQPWSWTPPSWEDRFKAVRTKEDASALWQEARKDPAMDRMELKRLVGIAQEILRGKG